MNTNLTGTLLVAIFGLGLAGCAGLNTYPEYVRAGDTVTVAGGWLQNFTKDNITVTITPSSGPPIVYAANDPAIRAVVNLYPDPVSSVVVSKETDQDLTFGARSYANVIDFLSTDYDRDWYQTTVFVDLPASLPVGTTSVTIETLDLSESVTSNVEVIGAGGSPATFNAEINGPLLPAQMDALERVPHYVISFSGPTVPYAIQLDMSHDADMDNGGTGRTHVINTRGDIKGVAWSDTGTSARVILTPAKGQTLGLMSDFKIYVAGGINNLAVTSVAAFDINGDTVAGVTAGITQ